MIKTFCNVCKLENNRNMVTEPLIIVDSDFTIRVEVKPVNDDDDVDLCHTCLMKRLNTKPKRKYVRKAKEADEKKVDP